MITFLVINYTGLGDRIAALSHVDSSAEARINAFDILKGLRFKDLLWGYSSRRIEYFQYIRGVEIIENFWIVWLLKLGVFATILLTFYLMRFLISIMSSISNDMRLTFIFVIFFVASTNNSLSSNTLVLSIFILAYYVLFNSIEENETICQPDSL